MSSPVPRCFISYCRDDNTGIYEGAIKTLRDHLLGELERITDGQPRVFFDADSVEAGESHRDTIHTELGHLPVFIVILTKNWIRSEYCQAEYVTFMQFAGGRFDGSLPPNGLIVPLNLATSIKLLDTSAEPVCRVLEKASYVDLETLLREHDFSSKEWRTFIQTLALRVRDWRRPVRSSEKGVSKAATDETSGAPGRRSSTPTPEAPGSPSAGTWGALFEQRATELDSSSRLVAPAWLDVPTHQSVSLETRGYREVIDQLIHRLGSPPLVETSESWFRSLLMEMNSVN